MDGYVAFLTIYTYTSVYLIDCYGRSMCPLFPAHCHCVAFFLDKITERYWLWFLQRTVRVLFAAIPFCTRTIPLLFRSDWYGWWEQLREHIGLQPSNQMKEYSTLGILDKLTLSCTRSWNLAFVSCRAFCERRAQSPWKKLSLRPLFIFTFEISGSLPQVFLILTLLTFPLSCLFWKWKT